VGRGAHPGPTPADLLQVCRTIGQCADGVDHLLWGRRPPWRRSHDGAFGFFHLPELTGHVPVAGQRLVVGEVVRTPLPGRQVVQGPEDVLPCDSGHGVTAHPAFHVLPFAHVLGEPVEGGVLEDPRLGLIRPLRSGPPFLGGQGRGHGQDEKDREHG
jgi:hypothetical protein